MKLDQRLVAGHGHRNHPDRMSERLLLFVAALLIALIVPSACQATITTSATTTTTAIATVTHCVLDDFYIILEVNWSPIPLMDTTNNTIGKIGFDYSVDYHIPCTDLQTIYDAIIENDIKSLSGPDLLGSETMIPPRTDYRITFRLNGDVYSVYYNSSVAYGTTYDSSPYPNLVALHGLLIDYYVNSNEYKSFPDGFLPY